MCCKDNAVTHFNSTFTHVDCNSAQLMWIFSTNVCTFCRFQSHHSSNQNHDQPTDICSFLSTSVAPALRFSLYFLTFLFSSQQPPAPPTTSPSSVRRASTSLPKVPLHFGQVLGSSFLFLLLLSTCSSLNGISSSWCHCFFSMAHVSLTTTYQFFPLSHHSLNHVEKTNFLPHEETNCPLPSSSFVFAWLHGVLLNRPSSYSSSFTTNYYRDIQHDLSTPSRSGCVTELPLLLLSVFTPRAVSTAIARYNFAARDMRELSLREGDIVKIYSKIGGDQGWWKGEANGRVSEAPESDHSLFGCNLCTVLLYCYKVVACTQRTPLLPNPHYRSLIG